jgi:predicted Rossmann-fold nucleotide-binding protein
VDGYYDGLLAFMRSTVGQGFVSDWQMDLIQQSADLQTLLPQLIQEAGLSEGKGLDAI